MKKFNYSKCLLWVFVVGSILSCTEDAVTPKLEVTFNYNYTGAPKATTQPANSGSKINTPTTPTRLGYTFKAWNTNATGTGTDFNFETTPITGDLTLYAKWIQTFAVSFNYNYTDASAPTKELIEINKKVNKPTADPTRLGYTFKAWNTNATGTGTPFDFKTTPITENITLYAKWEIITYTVTFNYNYTGATPAVATQTANSGSKINTPTNPTRSDYIFKEWNTNATGTGTPFDFKTTPITENITLYAQWEIVTYTVTFNYNYTGAPKATNQTANSGSKINEPDPTRSGYTFRGWNTKADGTGEVFIFSVTPIRSNQTLYAKWQVTPEGATTYTVTFNYNYTGAPTPVPQTTNSGSKINAPTTPNRSDYTLKGWNTNVAGTGTDFNFETTPITRDITLYAQWEIITYTVTFNYNYTGATPAVVPQTINSGSKINTPTTPTRSEHTFKGWNTNASGTGTDFNFQTTPITKNITLYAQWQPNSQGATTYTVTFNYNYTDAPKAFIQKVTTGQTTKATTTLPDRANFTIGSWNLSTDGSGTDFNFETTTITENITLYAQWLYYPLNKSALQALLFTQNVDPTKIDTGRITDMSELFKGKTTFNGDISSWDTSKVTTMSSMFQSARAFNGNLSTWNTSKVTNMGFMFAEATVFNSDISKWNTSKVTNMGFMFQNASAFKGDISKWNTSKVTNMGIMFAGASIFNSDISKWNTSEVTTMDSMFSGASAFNGDISKWNTSNVTTMYGMFSGASVFNGALSKWNTSKVTTMKSMFYGAPAFNGDISKWNTSNVTTMYGMFNSASAFNGDISKWNTSKVTTMYGMFKNTSAFNGDISKWNTSNVTTMFAMFDSARAFNGDISKWNTSNVTTMFDMFDSASAFNGDISKWNTSKVTDMQSMFRNAKAFNQDLSTWEVSKVTTMRFMFTSSLMANTPCQWPVAFRPTGTVCLIKYPVTFNYNYTDAPAVVIKKVTTGQKTKAPTAPNRSGYAIKAWNTKADGTGTNFNFEATPITENITLYAQWEVAVTVTFDYNYAGAPTVAPQTVNSGSKINKIADPEGYKVTSWHSKADGTDTAFNFETTTITENITLYAQWLYYPLNKSALQTLLFTQNVDPTKIDTGRITDMSYLFNSKTTFNGDISGWDTSKVTTMSSMFYKATAFNGDISTWNTSSVTNMYTMFQSASAFNGDISTWNTSKVTTMQSMFQSASAFNGDISKWNTSKVTTMYAMFGSASAFNGDISKWNTSMVTNMNFMFSRASAFNGNISKWNTSEVTNMSDMFYKAYAFNQNLSTWNTSKVTTMNSMFAEAAIFNSDISTWNTSKVTNMQSMFDSASAFNRDISGWNTSSVTSMNSMFYKASAFNQNISTWNTSKVTNMSYMFSSASVFNQDLSTWNTSKVTNMSSMFNSSLMANTPCQWPVAFRPTGTVCLIKYPVTFNYNYTDAPTAIIQKVTTGQKTKAPTAPTRSGYAIKAWNNEADGSGADFNFETTTITKSLTLYAQWEVAINVTFNYNYEGAPKAFVQKIATGQTTKAPTTLPDRANFTIGSWTISPDGTGTAFNFETTTITENITLYAKWVLAINVTFNYNYTGAPKAFVQKVAPGQTTKAPTTLPDRANFTIGSWTLNTDGTGSTFNFETTTITENTTLYAQWLYYPLNKSALQALLFTQNVDPTKIDTSRITDMSLLFNAKTTFNGDISGWNTSKVTTMQSMFLSNTTFNQDISKWNTSKVTDMRLMFFGSSAFNQDLSGWNTSSVTSMDSMFYNAKVFHQNLSKWNTSKVTSMSSMFSGASAFNGDISKWNTSEVTNMSDMFSRASAFNGNISGWNTSKVSVMSYMFSNTTAFNQDLSTWDVSSVNGVKPGFRGSPMANKPCQWPVAFRPSGTSCP